MLNEAFDFFEKLLDSSGYFILLLNEFSEYFMRNSTRWYYGKYSMEKYWVRALSWLSWTKPLNSYCGIWGTSSNHLDFQSTTQYTLLSENDFAFEQLGSQSNHHRQVLGDSKALQKHLSELQACKIRSYLNELMSIFKLQTFILRLDESNSLTIIISSSQFIKLD